VREGGIGLDIAYCINARHVGRFVVGIVLAVCVALTARTPVIASNKGKPLDWLKFLLTVTRRYLVAYSVIVPTG